MSTLSDTEFTGLSRLLQDLAGLQLSQAKKLLVCGRLADRLGHHGLESYGDYLALIEQDPSEQQAALDLLTSNETQFFREPRHFGFLTDHIVPPLRDEGAMRVWSAACSSGEEAYSIAMVLLHALGHERFEVLASDINTRMLHEAREGMYAIERARDIPWAFRSSYCLKGIGQNEGRFLMDRPVRERVLFEQINLNAPLPDIGQFDVIFLRNVMSGFPLDTRHMLIERVLPCLKPGGWLFLGEAERLHGLPGALKCVRPSIYQRAAPGLVKRP